MVAAAGTNEGGAGPRVGEPGQPGRHRCQIEYGSIGSIKWEVELFEPKGLYKVEGTWTEG